MQMTQEQKQEADIMTSTEKTTQFGIFDLFRSVAAPNDSTASPVEAADLSDMAKQIIGRVKNNSATESPFGAYSRSSLWTSESIDIATKLDELDERISALEKRAES